MPTLKQYGSIKDGKLILANRKRFEEDLRGFKDCQVEIVIKKKNRRSLPQNRYYWGVVVKEIQLRMIDLGNEVDEETVHEFLKDKFNKVDVIGPGGEVIDMMGGSTTEMNKDDFSCYVDKIIRWAAAVLEIVIPLPNEKLQFEF